MHAHDSVLPQLSSRQMHKLLLQKLPTWRALTQSYAYHVTSCDKPTAEVAGLGICGRNTACKVATAEKESPTTPPLPILPPGSGPEEKRCTSDSLFLVQFVIRLESIYSAILYGLQHTGRGDNR